MTQGFWLGKCEISQGQWESVMGTTPWAGQRYVQDGPEYPADYISWNDVQGFVQALNQAAGDSLYRLPTEAEWEYACRAGTTTLWWFGDDEEQLGDYAWYLDNAWDAGLQYAQPVGTKLPNPWGLYNMHGNVSEWVQDRHWAYPRAPQVDPQGPSSGPNRVKRHGAFAYHAKITPSATRGAGEPGADDNYGQGARLLMIWP